MPFLLGELADFYSPEILTHVPMINRAMHELAAEQPFIRVVRTEALTHCGDFLHFDTVSAHELGRRYFAEFIQSALPSAAPQELKS